MTEHQGQELVVLLDDGGQPCGTAPKHEVHHARTPLHLAFSCWLFDEQGRTLLTRRASAKRTWPDAWTNSFCGHPSPGEEVPDAVRRRAADELGTTVLDVAVALPTFRYHAAMPDGTMENEVCPVFTARLAAPPEPNPDEVSELRWVGLDRLRDEVGTEPEVFSPWMRMQLDLLDT